MKKIIAVSLLLIATKVYAQDSGNSKSRKLSPAEMKKYGKFINAVVNGKNTLIKNPNYDPSKFLKRDTAYLKFDNGIVAIYNSGATRPIMKKEFIYDLNSVTSNRLLELQERIAKYSSSKGVLEVYLKPGIVAASIPELFDKFNINKENRMFPLYIDFRPVSNQHEILALPQAVFKIEAVTDNDGVQFLNIATKAWEETRKKYGDDVIYIK